MHTPNSIRNFFEILAPKLPEARLNRVIRYTNRLFEQTLTRLADGTIFVVTGDIPAMWIRDSTWQMMPLLQMQPDIELAEIIGSVSRRQARYLSIDPYANAFNKTASGACWHMDFPDQSPWVFERKFELDSWSTFFELALSLFERTSYSEHLDSVFWDVSAEILNLCIVEQNHDSKSYRLIRENAQDFDYLSHNGHGAPVGFTGMVWSGFRPSDDRCVYGYHIPSNAHLACTLERLAHVASIFEKHEISAVANRLHNEIKNAVDQTSLPNGRYPYEVDGLGNAIYMDDPNIPSLLAFPELGWCSPDDSKYLATRNWILSEDHKNFVSSENFVGLASEHTPAEFIWPLSIAMQGLTTTDTSEKLLCLEMLEASDGGTDDMHESFNFRDPKVFTRSWFSWADMTYISLVLSEI